MANQKKIIIVVCIVILSLLAVFYMVKGHLKNQENGLPNTTVKEEEAFGIIDMDRAIKAHPQYEQLTKLKEERNTLELNLDKAKPVQLDNAAPQIDFAAIDSSIQQKKNEKVKKKFDELNEKLQKQEAEIRKQFSQEYEQESKKIDDQYIPEIFNLQLKLNTLAVSEQAATEIKRQINELKTEQGQKRYENQQKFLAKIADLMKENQEKARKELDEYAAGVEKELVDAAHKQVGEIEVRNNLAMAEKTNELKIGMDNSANVRERIENKEKEIATLEDKIIKDIASKVAKIAIANKLTVVLTAVQVNVNAMDITELVIKEFNN